MLTFNEYFGGLDKYNLSRGRSKAFFVYNRAASRRRFVGRIGGRILTTTMYRQILNAIPKDTRLRILGPTTGRAVGVGFWG